MKRIGGKAFAFALMAGMAFGGNAFAQSVTGSAAGGGYYGGNAAREKLTPEEIEANGEKTVIINFMSDVNYWSALQLVVQVQGYYRDGYRKFVIPIQTAGGAVASAMYAYETISRMPITITTVALGDVDSSGVYLYCMGEKRYAAPGATFLFHPMNGSLNPNRRGQEAAERRIENLTVWSDGVNKACFGEVPDAWDLERRDYRVLADEAGEVGLVNAGSDYFEGIEPIGDVTYVTPTFYPSQQYSTRQ